MRKFFFIAVGLLMSGFIHYAGQPVSAYPNYKLTQNSGPTILESVNQQACNAWVDSVMGKLSLREKVGQLFIYTIAPHDNKKNLELLHDAVSSYKVGGLLFSGGQILTQASLTNKAQQMAKVPLVITFDGEWGLAMRLKGTPSFPRNMVLGCIANDSLIYEYGKEVARECREIGVQVNFAPVADVNINPKNPVINTRSFGEDPKLVAQKVVAYGKGIESGKVLSVSKHFPGHGDTDIDSHHALPILPFSRQRLDSIEIYPFDVAIKAGLGGMMVGHLHVPALEPSNNLPASLSSKVVNDLLVDELGFKGLVFTDALAMKGVAGNKDVSLQALKAGNDMVLAPRNLKVEIDAVISAIERKEISVAEIEAKCRKVLTYKYVLGLNKKPHIQLSGLENRVSTPYAAELINRLNNAAITVLKNEEQTIPLPLDTEECTLALLEIRGKSSMTNLKQGIEKYFPIKNYTVSNETTEAQKKQISSELSKFSHILVSVNDVKIGNHQNFLNDLATLYPNTPIIYLCFTQGKALLTIEEAVKKAQTVVLAHTSTPSLQTQVAQLLFGKAMADGRLSMSLGNLFMSGEGVTIQPQKLTEQITSSSVRKIKQLSIPRIDSIALDGIQKGAYPGCQVLVLKNGDIIYQKSFGTHIGGSSQAVKNEDLYDIASITKTSGTLLALMKLYDEGTFNLSDKLSTHLTWLKGTDKENITIREILFHQSGLPASINFYNELIDKDSFEGPLFSNKKTNKYSVQVGNKTWATPNFKLIKEMTSPIQTSDCTLRVCENLWVNKAFIQQMHDIIIETPLRTKQYRYSDIGFILLRELAEKLSGTSMDIYLNKEFYQPMGLDRIAFNPLSKFSKEEIVPSSNDQFFRKKVLQGYVHDESSALQGGVSGSAGLFANAEEIATIYQMLLNGGVLNGKRYLSKETCRLFTTETSKISRRGLGFDKPEPDSKKINPCSPSTPMSAFGHTGFTGTCVWADPKNDLVYVFLSNRTYPTIMNRKLMQMNVRPNIQEAIYEATVK